MIWQDPVDYSHITYEYDHSLLEQEEGGTEARQLTQKGLQEYINPWGATKTIDRMGKESTNKPDVACKPMNKDD